MRLTRFLFDLDEAGTEEVVGRAGPTAPALAAMTPVSVRQNLQGGTIAVTREGLLPYRRPRRGVPGVGRRGQRVLRPLSPSPLPPVGVPPVRPPLARAPGREVEPGRHARAPRRGDDCAARGEGEAPGRLPDRLAGTGRGSSGTPDMCGIAGWLGAPALDDDEQGRVQQLLSHRGPDDEGRFVDAEAGVGLLQPAPVDHRPEPARPPADAERGRARSSSASNGEIYNFAELRPELEAKGHVVRSRTDSEVLLHGWEEWGEGVLERGPRDVRVRDLGRAAEGAHSRAPTRWGSRPLFLWWSGGGRLTFASELKAFLGLAGFSARHDPVALRQFLEFSFVPDLERTSLEGVRKLPPGHVLTVTAEGRRSRPEGRGRGRTTPRPASSGAKRVSGRSTRGPTGSMRRCRRSSGSTSSRTCPSAFSSREASTRASSPHSRAGSGR